MKRYAYKCGIEMVSDPCGFEYDGLVHQIGRTFGHNSKLDKHMDVHAKGSYWVGLGTCGFAQAQVELAWHSVGTPANKTG